MATLIVNTDTGVRRCTLQIAEEESFAATHRGAVLYASAQRQCQLTVLRHVDIQVGTVVETIIFKGLVVVVRESLEERVLVQETGRYEVSHLLRSSVHIHVDLLLPCRIIHYIINPVRIRECRRHVVGAEMFHHILTEADTGVGIGRVVGDVGRTGPLAHWQCIGDGRVVPHLSIRIGVGEIHELGNLLNGSTCRDGHRCLAWRTALGGNQNNAVSTSHTEHGRCRGVLQDRDVGNFIGVELSERTLHTIHEYQRLGTVQRTCTTHTDYGFISTRHTRRLYHRHTRQLTLQGVGHAGHRRFQQLVAAHLRYSTGDGHLLLLAIGNHHHLFQILLVGLHSDVYALTGHLARLRQVTHVRELQRTATIHLLQAIMTIHVGNATCAFTLYSHGHTYQGLARLVGHRAFHRKALGKCCIRHQT